VSGRRVVEWWSTLSLIGAGLSGLRVRIGYFFARHQISIGLIVVPASVPTGAVWHPYPHLSGLLPAGLRIFFTRCHLYAHLTTNPFRLMMSLGVFRP
jgi:hypothetical protein